MLRIALIAGLCILVTGCTKEPEASVREFNMRPVILPDGTRIQAEVVMHQIDMARGLMFRDSLPEGRGMLFIHGSPGKYSYWMYQVNIPLDIIWMDARGRIVEVVENAPPCKTASSQCPNYGGTRDALVVLELPGGSSRRHGVAKGEFIKF